MATSLPRGWKQSIKSAMVHVAGLARVAIDSTLADVATTAEAAVEIDRRDQLRDDRIHILLNRFAKIPARQRLTCRGRPKSPESPTDRYPCSEPPMIPWSTKVSVTPLPEAAMASLLRGRSQFAIILGASTAFREHLKAASV